MSARPWRILVAIGGGLAVVASIVLAALLAYRITLVVGLLVGFVACIWFLTTHRPRLWWRAEALAAMGMPVAMAMLYGRSLILVALMWPGPPPRSTTQAVFSIVALALVDAVLIAKVVAFRRFVRRDRLGLPHPGQPVPPEVADKLRTRILDLEEELTRSRRRTGKTPPAE